MVKLMNVDCLMVSNIPLRLVSAYGADKCLRLFFVEMLNPYVESFESLQNQT